MHKLCLDKQEINTKIKKSQKSRILSCECEDFNYFAPNRRVSSKDPDGVARKHCTYFPKIPLSKEVSLSFALNAGEFSSSLRY